MLVGPYKRMLDRRAAWLGRLGGLFALLLSAWASMYGKLWVFESMEAHRFTARSIMTGTLRLRSAIALAKPDEQIHNGAVFTNWGFGVPLLQIPFHSLALAANYLHGFFPDRAIYFFYLTVTIPILWAALQRLLAMRTPHPSMDGAQARVSWGATWLVLTLTVYPLMSTRFLIFEETIAYLMICEYLALAAYIFALESWSPRAVCAMAVAAGTGLLVRPTGLLYLGVWGGMIVLSGQYKRALQFAAVAAPFLAFWLYTNWVRGGTLLGLGYANSNPAWEYETPLLRFGTVCTDTPLHALQAAARLFDGFFFFVSRTAAPWMRACHFDFEERDHMRDPFFGPGLLVLLAGILWGLLRRRERRLWLYVPLAAFAALFLMFVRRGDGFAWRYQGDFWPLAVLAAVVYVHTLPAGSVRLADSRMAKILFWAGVVALARYWVPWEWTFRANVLGPAETAAMWGDFSASRWGHDEPLPSRQSCLNVSQAYYHNGLGWHSDCTVATFTNLYLGVPPRGPNYTIHLQTSDMDAPSVRLYVNGRYYEARKVADRYDVDVDLDLAEFHSPIVLMTVQWAPGLVPPAGKFLSAEIVGRELERPNDSPGDVARRK